MTDPQQPVIKADSEERQRKLFALIQSLIRSMSKREPLIIIVDDLHWIDPSSDIFAGQRRYLNEATIIAEKVPDPEIKLGLLQRRYVAEFHK